MLLGKLCAWLAGAFDFQGAGTHLMDTMLLPPEPTPAESCLISSAFQDSFNPGAMNMLAHGASALYPVFMDDTGNMNIRLQITATITASVLMAYIIFGFPGNNLWANRPPCIIENKWTAQLTHMVTFLGFQIDTWAMTVTWLFAKQQRLHQQITDILFKYHKGGFIPCCALAQALGLLRNGCYVLPLGITMSLQLQHTFNDCIKK